MKIYYAVAAGLLIIVLGAVYLLEGQGQTSQPQPQQEQHQRARFG